MTRIAIYYPIHFIGIFLLFLAIGGMCISCRNGVEKKDNPSRKFLAITHGIALLMVIIGGMGLMTGFMYHKAAGGMPPWIILKLVIWVIFGCSSLIIYKLPKLATVTFFIFMALGAFAALAAKFQSFTGYSNYFN